MSSIDLLFMCLSYLLANIRQMKHLILIFNSIVLLCFYHNDKIKRKFCYPDPFYKRENCNFTFRGALVSAQLNNSCPTAKKLTVLHGSWHIEKSLFLWLFNVFSHAVLVCACVSILLTWFIISWFMQNSSIGGSHGTVWVQRFTQIAK